MRDTEWWERAACAGQPLAVFYGSGPSDRALQVCANCPVVAPCLAEALRAEAAVDAGVSFGVRGGMTARQRRKIIREMRSSYAKS